MKTWMMAIVCMLLTACASTTVEYQPAPITDAQARSVIEQVLMEQPLKQRPEQVYFTQEFVGYGSGQISNTSGFGSGVGIGNGALVVGSSVTSSKSVQTRIYYSSIGSVTLYSKRSRWVVITRNRAGTMINSSLVDTEPKAKRFVDALMHFRNPDVSG